MNTKIETVNIDVIGMTCASCAMNVEKVLRKSDGVNSANVSIANNQARIDYDPVITNLNTLRSSVAEIGYELLIEIIEQEQKDRLNNLELLKLRRKLIVAVAFSLPLAVLSMYFHHHNFTTAFIMFLLSLPVIFFSGSHFFSRAAKQVIKAVFTMDALVSLGVGSAFLYSLVILFFPEVLGADGSCYDVYFEAAAIIITLVLLGKNLEERTKRKANDSVKSLMKLQSKKAILSVNDLEVEIDIDKLKKDDIVIVKHGEKIPIDGIIISGSASVDESMINGESVPIDKIIGDEVIGGSVNLNGYLKMRVQKTGTETMLAKIIKVVENAQNSKPEIQKLADKISSVFVPAIILLAGLVFSYWYFMGNDFQQGIISMATVLVVACPCALGLATPTAIIAGIGRASELGVLIKDAGSQEALSMIDTVIFDKTGSLTVGKPEVSEEIWFQGEIIEIPLNPALKKVEIIGANMLNGGLEVISYDQSELSIPSNESINLKEILYSLESLSSHPLAKAVTNHYEKLELNKIEPESFESFAGFGILGRFFGKDYYVGSENFIRSIGVQFSLSDEIKKKGVALAVFADSEKVLALICLRDKIKESSICAVQFLLNRGIEVILSSGDNEQVVEQTAKSLGINKYYFRQTPIDKAELIKSLQDNGKRVAMLGDGVNDAPALVSANVGIAMANGSDLALESAEIAILNGDLSKFIDSYRLSLKIKSIIRQNLFWAFFYNLIMIPIAAGLFIGSGITLNPMIAAGAMAISSISVVSNSLRLKFFKKY
ncbi:MAG: heavy metal translocating P-type ATPase [Candidatus Kapabacteria bacterium]|nr:heavy metal translocating P-type ATPase [Candidatus Kapabacteria bacterium]